MQGLQTAVIVDGDVTSEMAANGSSHGETWIGWPSTAPNGTHPPLTCSNKWALAPFLAHKVWAFGCQRCKVKLIEVALDEK